ncbi:hypothetical protein EZS27_010387 [termite gut metagenome]|uniref:Golvesin/Xly CBD-like domain-containing protein n=1 Tax=termite gut metagenome TaxID=433724 RepID=A0A5J4S9F0_9ZZZZ
MNRNIFFAIVFLILMVPFNLTANVVHEVDICVYGGTSAGVIAAYTAKQSGKSVILIEPGQRLGGLSSGGLGQTDIGNKYAITGLARDFYRRIGQHYGKFEQWIFEPKVAEAVFQDYVKQGKINVIYRSRLLSAKKVNGSINEILLENTISGKTIPIIVRAKMYIDCTYEGDLIAQAGVPYAVGREDNKDYGETINGVQLMNRHQFPDGIDPYQIPGKPESGLLWGITDYPLEPTGTGDKKVQAYNYRICLTSDKTNMIPITRPESYDSTRYELLIRLIKAQPNKISIRNYFTWSAMPGNKTDINNSGGFSTDMIGANYAYPDGSYPEREKIIREHEVYTKGLLYFVGHDSRIPAAMRDEMLQWGYPADEYTDNGHWTPQLYIREARRMIGAYVMTQANCQGKEIVEDGVGMAAYTMDSHNCQRIVLNGQVKNEGNVEVGGFEPYPVAYRSITPKQSGCRNLLVPVCLSATHIAYGSIRMEPVFMVLGQSAAVAASMAIDTRKDVQQIDLKKLQQQLKDRPLVDNSLFEILVENDDNEHVEITGDWETFGWPCYGRNMLRSKGNGSVKYIPEIPRNGQYDVYLYLSPSDGLASDISVTVFDGKNTMAHIVKPFEIIVQGQTSGEWVSLGKYHLPKGKKGNITVHTNNAVGIVPADAVILVPSKNNKK